MPRETKEIETQWGKVRVKLSGPKEAPTTITPEYEDCRQIATTNGVALRVVIEEARKAALTKLK
jgi:uncharacterized protein (DUF111 family)